MGFFVNLNAQAFNGAVIYVFRFPNNNILRIRSIRLFRSFNARNLQFLNRTMFCLFDARRLNSLCDRLFRYFYLCSFRNVRLLGTRTFNSS